MAEECKVWKIRDCLYDYLRKSDWLFWYDKASYGFRLLFKNCRKSILTSVSFFIYLEDGAYTVMADLPIKVDVTDAQQLANMAELIARINRGGQGYFAMDYEQGRLCYNYRVDCEDQLPSKRIIDNSLGEPFARWCVFVFAFLDVLCAGTSPEKAIEKCVSTTDDFGYRLWETLYPEEAEEEKQAQAEQEKKDAAELQQELERITAIYEALMRDEEKSQDDADDDDDGDSIYEFIDDDDFDWELELNDLLDNDKKEETGETIVVNTSPFSKGGESVC